MSDEIKSSFERKLVYRQVDIAQSELGMLEAVSSVWAACWSYEGLQHPITSRLRINIVHMLGVDEFDPISADIELWREFEWKAVDTCFQGCVSFNTIEEVENECLFMAESFLMGVNIEETKKKYGVDISAVHKEENTLQEDIKIDDSKVLKLFPEK